jgi:ATP-dependent Lhr-like helicase
MARRQQSTTAKTSTSRLDTPSTDDAVSLAAIPPLAGFHPAVVHWFETTFSSPTPPQAQAWPLIRAGRSTLVFAPTGTGKTLAAFLGGLDRLIQAPTVGAPRCRVLYVSPLKALATDVERNLQAPLVGIARCASLLGHTVQLPTVAVRTGDTDQRTRARFKKAPADVLITTPESLGLLLTSQAREALKSVETVIIDEIHALVPSKRGAHLALSLARLDALCTANGGQRVQRIGLSATQRPLSEVARYLGGSIVDGDGVARAVDVAIADARAEKRMEVIVDHTLIDDDAQPQAPSFASMAPVALPTPSLLWTSLTAVEPSSRTMSATAPRGTWQTIPPKIVDLAARNRTVLVFVNARRLAERMAAAINDVAVERGGVEIASAHHGSLARAQRQDVEERLKMGAISVLVATSSLELGVDLASVDVVVQIEAPPSVSAALQRIGRAGHSVGAVSRGVVFPRYASDLLACATIVKAMHEGAIEATRIPQNPIDVLCQHLVGMVAVEPWRPDDAYRLVCSAANYKDLPRSTFDAVIDLISGRTAVSLGLEGHDSLRGRVRLDHDTGLLVPRAGAHRIAVQNMGTIPDRGLYGVYLVGGEEGGPQKKVGELDEEMVFESRAGEVIRLGSSSWRIEEITADRVTVSPAPGQPGKLPFWRGEQLLRPKELGDKMAALTGALVKGSEADARARLCAEHGLVEEAANTLVRGLREQRAKAGGVIADDRTVVIERGRDELMDWRICVISPIGGAVLQPLALAMSGKARALLDLELELSVHNDGIVLRFPEDDDVPDVAALIPTADEVEALVLEGLSHSPVFAARFREAAGRALLLPRGQIGKRAALWKTRQRARDLLDAVRLVADFPITLEAAREVMHDVFDVPGLREVLTELEQGRRRVVTVDVETPTPMAAALLSGAVRSALYDGDVPLAERRAQALSIDITQLKALLGEGALRELLDEDVIDEVDRTLQRRAPGLQARHEDDLHDILIRLGALSLEGLAQRVAETARPSPSALLASSLANTSISAEVSNRAVDNTSSPAKLSTPVAIVLADRLVAERRATWIRVAGEARLVAIEDIARYRDALGVPPPPGVPETYLAPTTDALIALVRRVVRTHALQTAHDVATALAVPEVEVAAVLRHLVQLGHLVSGALRPGGTDVDYADPEVLQTIRRRTLARLRNEVAPVDEATFIRARLRWHGIAQASGGGLRGGASLDGLLDAIARLQGLPMPWSILESFVLPARVPGYRPEMLDALAAAGEVRWVGVAPRGERDGVVMLFLTDSMPHLWVPPPSSAASPASPASSPSSPAPSSSTPPSLTDGQRALLSAISRQGAMFAPALQAVLATSPTPPPSLTSLSTSTTAMSMSMSTSPSSPLPTPSFTQWQAARRGTPDVSGGDGLDVSLWALVWAGLVTNDTFRPLRARLTGDATSATTRRRGARSRGGSSGLSFRSRRHTPQHLEGRWSLTAPPHSDDHLGPALTRRAAAAAEQLLVAHGVLGNDAIASALENGLPISPAAVKSALRVMEDAGRIRRGYFVDGAAGLQYGTPAAVDALRQPVLRRDVATNEPSAPRIDDDVVLLSAVDPASPWGAHLAWPRRTNLPTEPPPGPARAAAAVVVIDDGHLVGFIAAGAKRVISFLPDQEPERSARARGLAHGLAIFARRRRAEGRAFVVADVDGCVDAGLAAHPVAEHLQQVGFMRSAGGYVWPRHGATMPTMPTMPTLPSGVRAQQLIASPTIAPQDDGDGDDGVPPWGSDGDLDDGGAFGDGVFDDDDDDSV